MLFGDVVIAFVLYLAWRLVRAYEERSRLR